MGKEETKIGFVRMFKSKYGPPRLISGPLYDTHIEAENSVKDLSASLQKAFIGIGKIRYKAQV